MHTIESFYICYLLLLMLVLVVKLKIKIEKIDFIDIVDKFEDDKGVTELKYLPAHLSDKRYFN